MINDPFSTAVTGDFSNVQQEQSFAADTPGVSVDQPVEQSFLDNYRVASPETTDARSTRYDYALDKKSPGVDMLAGEIQAGQDDAGRLRRAWEDRADLNLRRASLLESTIKALPPEQVTPEVIKNIQAMDKAEVDAAYADPKTFYERKFAAKAIATAYEDQSPDPEKDKPIKMQAAQYNNILINQASARRLYEDANDALKDRTWGQAIRTNLTPFYSWVKLSSAYDSPDQDTSFFQSKNIRSQIESAYRLNPDEFVRTQTEAIEKLKESDPQLALEYASALLGYTSSDAFRDNIFNTLDYTMLTPGTIAGLGVGAYRLGKLAGRLPFDYASNLKMINMAGRMNTMTKQLAQGKINYVDLLPVERQAHAVALENIRRKAANTGQAAQWDELAKTVQPIHNPQSILEGATNMSAEEAARLEVGLLRTARTSLDELISRPRNLERLSPEELALSQSNAEKYVDTMYAQTTRGSRLVMLKSANVDAGNTVVDTDAIAKYYASSKGTGYATEQTAKTEATKAGIQQYETENINGQWYVKFYQYVDEKDSTLQAFARPSEKYSDKPNRSFLSGIMSRTRMRDSLVPNQLAEDFKYAQAATNAYFEANKRQFNEDFGKIYNKKDFDSFLERERDYREQLGTISDGTVVRGRYARNVGEFTQRWMKELGRTPTFDETKAYFSWQQWNDVDYAVRNLDLTRDMVRIGIQNHKFRFRIPGDDTVYWTPDLEGKALVAFPWDRQGDAGIIIWDVNPQTETTTRLRFLRDKPLRQGVEGSRGGMMLSKEYIDDLIQNKGYRVYQLAPHAKKRLADHLASHGGPENGVIPPKDNIKTIPVEPAVPAGMTRVYHSGQPIVENETNLRWVSTDRTYASNYRQDQPLHYYDLPSNDPRVNNLDYPDQGVKQGFTFNFELTPEEAAGLQQIARPPEAPETVNHTFTSIRGSLNKAAKASPSGRIDIDAFLRDYVPGATRNQLQPILQHLIDSGQASITDGKFFFRKLSKTEAVQGRFNLVDRAVSRIRAEIAQTYPNVAQSNTFNLSAIFNPENTAKHEFNDKGLANYLDAEIKAGRATVTNPDTGEELASFNRSLINNPDAPDYTIKFNQPANDYPNVDYSQFNFSVEKGPKVELGKLIEPNPGSGFGTIFHVDKKPEGYISTRITVENGKKVRREIWTDNGWQIVRKGEGKIDAAKYYPNSADAIYNSKQQQQLYQDQIAAAKDFKPSVPAAPRPIEGYGEHNIGDEVYLMTDEDQQILQNKGKLDLPSNAPTSKITEFYYDPNNEVVRKAGLSGAAVKLESGNVLPVERLYKPGSKKNNVTLEPYAAPENPISDAYKDYDHLRVKISGNQKATMRVKLKDDGKTIDLDLIEAITPDGSKVNPDGSLKGKNTLGPVNMKKVLQALKDRYPSAEQVEMLRVTGARRSSARGQALAEEAGGIYPGEKVTVKLPQATESGPRYGEPPAPPPDPTAPTGKASFNAWTRPSYDYIIAKPEMDVQTNNLNFVRFPRQEGGHRIDGGNDWFNRQPQIYTHSDAASKAKIHTYEGDVNAYSAVIESDARDFNVHLENIRKLLDEDLANKTNNAENYYNQFMDGTSRNFKEFKNQFAEFHKDGHLTVKHPFVVTPRDQSSWSHLNNMSDANGNLLYPNLENARDSAHNLFNNELNLQFALERSDNLETVVRRGTAQAPIFGSQTSGSLSPMSTLINSTSQLIRGRVIDDLKFKSAETFAKAYADVIDAPLESLRRDPMNYLINPSWKKNLKGQDLILLNSAKDYRRALLDFMGIEDTAREWAMTVQRSMGDFIKRRLRQGSYDWVDRHLLRSGAISPLRWANNLVFDIFQGAFNIKQLIVQGITSIHPAAVLGPKIGYDAGISSVGARMLLFNERKDLTDLIARNLSKASLGSIKPEHFVEALSSLKRSGWHIIGNETAMKDDFLHQSIMNDWLETSREWGRAFFKEGDRHTRNTAYFASYFEWRRANPTAALTARVEKEILNRADTLSLNMTAASNAMMAKGISGVPLKYTAYYLRFMEQMLPGIADVKNTAEAVTSLSTQPLKRKAGYGPLTTQEKMRAFALYSTLYGAPITASGVFGLWPLHKEWAKMLQDRGYETDENKVLQFFNGGLAETLPSMLGVNMNFSEALGNPGTDWFYDIYNGRSPLFDIVTGVAGTKLADVYHDAWPFFTLIANAFRADENAYPLSWADLEAFVRIPSSVNNLWRAIQMYNTGVYATKSMTPLARGQDGVDALMTLLTGAEPKSVQKAFIQSDMTKTTRAMKQAAKKDILKYNRLHMKAIAEGDIENAMQYGKAIRYIIISNGFTADEMNGLFSDSVTANGDLVRLAQKNFYSSTPERQKLFIEKMKSKREREAQ